MSAPTSSDSVMSACGMLAHADQHDSISRIASHRIEIALEPDDEEETIINVKRKLPNTSTMNTFAGNKRRDTRSEHERRLMGEYEAPADATPISFPMSRRIPHRESMDVDSRTVPLKRRGISATFKPRNTLNSKSPHAGRLSVQKGDVSKSSANEDRDGRVSLDIMSAMDKPPIRVSLLSDHHKTSFPKRRKLDDLTRSQAVGLFSDPIEVDDDEASITHDSKAKNSPRVDVLNGSRDQRLLDLDAPPPPFTNTEFENVQSRLQTQQGKRRRRSQEGHGASQASKPANPAVTKSRVTASYTVHEHLITTPEDLPLLRSRSSFGIRPKQPEVGARSDRVNSTSSSWQTNGTNVSLSKMPEPKTDRLPQGYVVVPHTLEGPKMYHSVVSDSVPYVRGSQHPTTAPVRPSSVSHGEDDRASFGRLPKARDRMRESSSSKTGNVSPVNELNDSFESPDELQSGNTVISRASRSISPQKPASSQTLCSLPHNRRQSRSPAHLSPTHFKPASHRSPGARAAASTTTYDPTPPQDNIFPLRAFFATSATLETGNITLVLDKQSNAFELWYESTPCIVPGKKKTVKIGPAEIQKMIFNSTNTHVCLEGVIGDTSHKYICLAFHELRVVELFLHTAKAIKGDRLKQSELENEILNTTFRNRCKDIRKRLEADERSSSANTTEIRSKCQQALLSSDLDHEEIVYEDDASVREREASVIESPYFVTGNTRRSSRQTKPSRKLSPSPPPVVRWTQQNHMRPWSHSVVYPYEGARRVTVDFQDLERLDEGEFLNDNIISFALRHLEETMNPEHKENVHFFNTFFYSALTTLNGRRSFNYDAVKRWTKNKDLFNYPFVVVPINNAMHWFLAIVCNLPNLKRKTAGSEEEDEDKYNAENVAAVADVDEPIESGAFSPKEENDDSIPDSQAMEGLTLSERGNDTSNLDVPQANAESLLSEDESLKHIAAVKNLAKARSKKPKRQYVHRPVDPATPAIVTIDSLELPHPIEVKNLKDYFCAEADSKRGMSVDIGALKGVTAKGVPRQENFCDCGIYLVGYIEQFAKDPQAFMTKALTKQFDIEADFANFDPAIKRAQLRDALLNLSREQEAERKSKKTGRKSGVVAQTLPPRASNAEAPSFDSGVGKMFSTTSDRASIVLQVEDLAILEKNERHSATVIGEQEESHVPDREDARHLPEHEAEDKEAPSPEL